MSGLRKPRGRIADPYAAGYRVFTSSRCHGRRRRRADIRPRRKAHRVARRRGSPIVDERARPPMSLVNAHPMRGPALLATLSLAGATALALASPTLAAQGDDDALITTIQDAMPAVVTIQSEQ